MHNTYFVVPMASLLVLFFLVFASMLTIVRALAKGFRTAATNVVLGLLAVGWLGVFAIGALLVWPAFHRH
jgi:hypothetical protein